MLHLLPEVGNLDDLSKLRAALVARLERVEESLKNSERKSSVQVAEVGSIEREEREMLKLALEFLNLQED